MASPHNVLRFSRRSWSSDDSARAGTAHHHPGFDWVMRVAEVNRITAKAGEGLLVGGSDQGSFGNLLIPQVLTRLLNFSRFRCAGLVSTDYSSRAGYSTRNFGESVLEMAGTRNLHLLHCGGESLGDDLVGGYLAAAEDEELERFESLADISDREELLKYVRRRTGQFDNFSHVIAPEGEFYGSCLSFHSVALPNPDELSAGRKKRLLEIMRGASFVGVKDKIGSDFLAAEGIDVVQMPCCLSVLPQVGARQLGESRDSEALNRIRHRFPNGWIAVDISGVGRENFEPLTAALREVSENEELGLVFFESTPPRSDVRRSPLRQWIESFAEWEATGFESKHIWETASFLLHSRLYCGSSLAARVVCMSGGVARINIPTGDPGVKSYCDLWEHEEVPVELSEDVQGWGREISAALGLDLSDLQEHANWLHRIYFDRLEEFCKGTGLSPCLRPGREQTDHLQSAAAFHHLQDEWLADRTSTRLFRKINRRLKTGRTHSPKVKPEKGEDARAAK